MSRVSWNLQLASFLKGLTSREQNRKIVRHLLAQLGRGVAMGGHLDYSDAFQRARLVTERQEKSLARERADAPESLRALAVQPAERRRAAVERHAAFRTWALCELLLDASQEWAFQDPERALDMARLGVEVAARLDRSRYGEERVNDLAARAWAVQGSVEGELADFQAAGRSFSEARRLLRAGTGDRQEKARIRELAERVEEGRVAPGSRLRAAS